MVGSGIDDLVEFWKDFDPQGRKPRVNEGDLGKASSMEKQFRKEKLLPLARLSTVSEFLKLPSLKLNGRFHLSLSPVPYMGNLHSAKIFLLMINPLAGYADYCTNEDRSFQEGLARTLRQEKSESSCLALNPKYCATSWFAYYERLFRSTLLERVNDDRKTPKSYWEALKLLADQLAIVELVPYYSGNASRISSNFLDRLPSAGRARMAAQDFLNKAENDEASLIVRWSRTDSETDRWRLGRSKKIIRIGSRTGLGKQAQTDILRRLD